MGSGSTEDSGCHLLDLPVGVLAADESLGAFLGEALYMSISSGLSLKATLRPSPNLGDADGGGGLNRLGFCVCGRAGASVKMVNNVLLCLFVFETSLTSVAVELHASKVVTQQLGVSVIPLVVPTPQGRIATAPPGGMTPASLLLG